ncbi:MAG: type II secretion system F family protein [Zoogloeaceae bacterium]|jgi:general secretion pathway protein F|nr:type II secretion system F family protein [Zoogloeaceae bacterium]
MRFSFKAIDGSGFQQKGRLDAASETEALQMLFERGYTTLDLREEKLAEARIGGGSSAIRHADVIALVRELATLLGSGVGISDAFNTLLEANQHSRLNAALSGLSAAIHGGDGFASALRKAKLKLPEYVYALARAGEATGDLAGALSSAAEQLEFEARMRGETREALIYPMILITTGIGAILFIFSFVVPRFTGILRGRQVELPALSEWVLNTGVFVNAHWLGIGLAFACASIGVSLLMKNEQAKTMLTMGLSRVPLLSTWITAGETSRWTSILAVLVQSRVPILMALELSAIAVRLPENAERLKSVADDVRLGKKLSSVIEERRLLTGTPLTMLKVGEKSGALGSMLGFVSTQAAEFHKTVQRRLVALIEPISILAIGASLGVIMVGIVLAMTSLTSVKL